MAGILVTAKVHPDLDGVSCSLSYAELLTRQNHPAVGLVFGSPQAEARFFQQQLNISLPIVSPDHSDNFSGFVLVDASSMKGMPSLVSADRVVEIIDHREGDYQPGEFPHAKVDIQLVGAAATLIVERFQSTGFLPTLEYAHLLYGAIFHNTLFFKSPNTHQRDKDAAKFIERQFGLTPKLTRGMFSFVTREITSDLTRAIAEDAKEFSAFKGSLKAYQLIVSDTDFASLQPKLEKAINLVHSSGPFFLNFVDISSDSSHILTNNDQIRSVLEHEFSAEFSGSWGQIHPMRLRKQLMPPLRKAFNPSL